jgi:3-oxoacyl-[acyl-carrier protein] reductase
MEAGRLQGKVAIVTGASRGIGAAIAARLAGDGATVVVNYAQSEKQAMELVATIRSGGGRASAIQASMADPAGVKALFERAFAEHGRLDILVNNAAIGDPRPLLEIDEAYYTEMWNLNVRGVLLATQEAARRFGDAGGRIINISSTGARMHFAGSSVYCASKAAIEALTRCHSAELGPRGITVNAVAPGPTDTDMLRNFLPDAAREALVQNYALRRLGTPEDIADVVAFVASSDSRWMTGQVIEVSGGMP